MTTEAKPSSLDNSDDKPIPSFFGDFFKGFTTVLNPLENSPKKTPLLHQTPHFFARKHHGRPNRGAALVEKFSPPNLAALK